MTSEPGAYPRFSDTLPGGCLLAALALAAGAPAHGSDVSLEYKVKAAYLFNFAKFIEWPPKAFSAQNTPFTFCVLGADPFGADLERTIKNETVGGREIAIRRLKRIQERDLCHVLFISSSEKDNLPQILGVLKNSSVVTVSEFDSFTQQGGMINLYVEDHRVRFEINLGPAENAGLRISSKLLKLAKLTR